MAKNFAAIAFSDAAKELQVKYGSRIGYARMEKDTYIDGLSDNEIRFIAGRDSFYLSTISASGYPYIQHRGGPKGFLKILDRNRIGFIDFTGNKQYISVGNLATNNHVSLMMMDYPAKARLKLFAKAEIIELKDNSDLYDLLDLEDYKFRPERMMVFTIEAYDWNCPQHITQRYTIEEIQDAFAPKINQMAKLEEEIKILKAKLKESGIAY